MSDYVHPETLVDTEWVAQHVDDPNVRLIDVDVDSSAYDKGHIATRSAGTGSPTCTTRRRWAASAGSFHWIHIEDVPSIWARVGRWV